MVCIPCIILPVALYVYCKFIQPFVLRWMPPEWRLWVDSWLYPTCPVKLPPPPTDSISTATTDAAENILQEQQVDGSELKRRNIAEGLNKSGKENDQSETCPCGGEDTSPLATLESNGHVVVGSADKKTD